jgi:hypothetical protein
MRKLLMGVAALAAITFAPLAHADPGEPIIGDAGGAEQPLPSDPGEYIGLNGFLPPDFLVPTGSVSGDVGPAGDGLGALRPSQFEHPSMPPSFQDYLDTISGKTTPRGDVCPVLTWQQLLMPCDMRGAP